jgi:hypothetical protein
MKTRHYFVLALLGLFVLAPPVRGQQARAELDLIATRYPRLAPYLNAVDSDLTLREEARRQVPGFGDAGRLYGLAAATPVWLLSQQVGQTWDAAANGGAGDWLDETRVVQSYNDDGYLIEQLLEDWDETGEVWVSGTRVTHTRDDMNRSLQTLYEDWDADANGGAGDWVSLQRFVRTYNAQGNTLVSTTEIWDEDEEMYLIFSRTTNTYDASGETVLESLSESDFFASSRRTYTYDGDGNVTEEVRQSFDDMTSAWVNSSRELNTYDTNGENVEEVDQDWDPAASGGAGDWVNDTRTLTAFSPDSSNPTEVVETDQNWDPAANAGAGAWVNDDREIATRTAGSSEEITQTWDPAASGGAGDWVNEERYVLSSDANGRYTDALYQVWDTGAGAWENEEQDMFGYNDDGLVESATTQTWSGTEWVNDYRLLQFYEEAGGVGTAVEGEQPAGRFQLEGNYPNPFREATTIRFTLPAPEHVTLEVFDLLGRRVATLVDAPMTPGRHEVTLEGTGLADGLYVYSLSSGGTRAARTLHVVK